MVHYHLIFLYTRLLNSSFSSSVMSHVIAKRFVESTRQSQNPVLFHKIAKPRDDTGGE